MLRLADWFMRLFFFVGAGMIFILPFWKPLQSQFFVAIMFLVIAGVIARWIKDKHAEVAAEQEAAGEDEVKAVVPAKAEAKTGGKPKSEQKAVSPDADVHDVGGVSAPVELHLDDSSPAGPIDVPLPEEPFDFQVTDVDAYANSPVNYPPDETPVVAPESRPRVRAAVKKVRSDNWVNPVYRGKEK